MHDAAQEIKSKIDIIDYLSKLFELKRAGRNFKALCPFHQEKTPSFMVSPDRQNWRCFGSCQEGGDIISFVMKWENCTFYEALKELATLTNTDLSKYEIQDDTYRRKNSMSKINDIASLAFSYYLNHPKIGQKAYLYLNSREIGPKIIKTFKIGFAPPSKKALINFLVKKGFNYQDIIDVGLAVKTYSGEIIDRFRNRIMFPIFDSRGIILGFSGRTVEESQKEAKYINTPETFLYKKRETLFGIQIAKKNIQDANCAVIVEGEFDMIACFQNGITNTVAIKGSALTEEQLKMISRYTKVITLALDGDKSGLSTTKRVLPDTEKMGFKVQIAMIKEGKDPFDALKVNPTQFKKTINKPVPVYDFIIDYEKSLFSLHDPYQKAEFMKEVGPFIVNIDNAIIKSHYLKKVGNLLNTDVQTIEKSLKTSATSVSNKVVKNQKKEDANYEKEKLLAALFFQSQNCYILFDKFLNHYEDFIKTPSIKKLFAVFYQYKQKNQSFEFEKFVSSIPKELVEAFDEIYLLDLSDLAQDSKERKLAKIALRLTHDRTKAKVKILITNGDKSDYNNKQIQSLTKELSEIEKQLALL